jgi:Na+/melibiose symporter-like transporter
LFSPFTIIFVQDEDCSLNKRPESASTVIYGANALFTKPGQSLAPMFGWALLRKVGYGSVKPTVELRGEGIGRMRSGMFEMLVVLPAACAVIQLVLWSQFTLRDSYLQKVKEQRRKVEV